MRSPRDTYTYLHQKDWHMADFLRILNNILQIGVQVLYNLLGEEEATEELYRLAFHWIEEFETLHVSMEILVIRANLKEMTT